MPRYRTPSDRAVGGATVVPAAANDNSYILWMPIGPAFRTNLPAPMAVVRLDDDDVVGARRVLEATSHPDIEVSIETFDVTGGRSAADNLRYLAAQRELLDRRTDRAVVAASDEGLSQQEIARNVGLSQPTVSRLLKRYARFPDLTAVTPREILLRRRTGEISTADALDILASWPWTFGHTDVDAPDGAESWVPGSWDDLIGRDADLLRDGEYEELRQQVRARQTPADPSVAVHDDRANR